MKKISLFIISLLIAACVFCPPQTAGTVYADEQGELTVHFIDVGQGDACIVELPDDRTMLIDAGENRNAVRAKLDEYITENIHDDEGNPIEQFDFVILTHSDSDHIGSMKYMLENYHAVTVYRPNEECTYQDCNDHANSGEQARNRFWGESHGDKATATYHNVLNTAYQTADEVIVTNPYDDTQNKITSTSDDEYEINFYSPLSSDYPDHNNYSPIIVIEYNGRKIVLTGDAETDNEQEFVEAAQKGEGRYSVFDDSFCADVIKLGHHGSRTSSTEAYLDIVTKSNRRSNVFVVISCGEGNSYGHPHPEVLTRLSDMGFNSDNILRTDLLGDIVVSIQLVDGAYTVVYGERTSGELPPEQPSLIDQLLAKFNSLQTYQKVVVLAIIAIVVILILLVVAKVKGKKKNKKKGRR